MSVSAREAGAQAITTRFIARTYITGYRQRRRAIREEARSYTKEDYHFVQLRLMRVDILLLVGFFLTLLRADTY